MLADLMYQRNEGDQALKHFAQLLERNPSLFLVKKKHYLKKLILFKDHYHALAHYIELGWRKGDLEQVEKYMKTATESNPRANVDAGYNYCKGLIEW
jgi:tetratricopeptide (TPR) repeat protein